MFSINGRYDKGRVYIVIQFETTVSGLGVVGVSILEL